MPKLQGFAWHKTYLKSDGEKRNRNRCIYHGASFCMHPKKLTCTGSTHCEYYSEDRRKLTELKVDNKGSQPIHYNSATYVRKKTKKKSQKSKDAKALKVQYHIKWNNIFEMKNGGYIRIKKVKSSSFIYVDSKKMQLEKKIKDFIKQVDLGVYIYVEEDALNGNADIPKRFDNPNLQKTKKNIAIPEVEYIKKYDLYKGKMLNTIYGICEIVDVEKEYIKVKNDTSVIPIRIIHIEKYLKK